MVQYGKNRIKAESSKFSSNLKKRRLRQHLQKPCNKPCNMIADKTSLLVLLAKQYRKQTIEHIQKSKTMWLFDARSKTNAAFWDDKKVHTCTAAFWDDKKVYNAIAIQHRFLTYDWDKSQPTEDFDCKLAKHLQKAPKQISPARNRWRSCKGWLSNSTMKEYKFAEHQSTNHQHPTSCNRIQGQMRTVPEAAREPGSQRLNRFISATTAFSSTKNQVKRIDLSQ